MAEQHLDLLDSLLAGLWISEVELDRTSQTECTEDDEQSPADILKSWRNKTIAGSAFASKQAPIDTYSPMAKLNNQFPIAAIPMPVARVSRDQTSAAYTQQMGARVSA